MTTPKNLSELFEQVRRAQAEVPVSEIKSLLESGKNSPLAAKPSFRPRRITRLFNPLKLIVMITPIVIITSALLIFNPGSGKKPAGQKDSLSLSKAQVVIGVENSREGNSIKVKHQKLPTQKAELKEIQSLSQSKSPTETSDTLGKPENLLKLDTDVFKCLGFNIEKGGFSYQFLVEKTQVKLSYGLHSKDGLYVIDYDPSNQNTQILESVPVLGIRYGNDQLNSVVFIPFDLVYKVFGRDTLNGTSFQEALELCIPITFKDTTLSKKLQDCAFWVFPNQRFLNCLPLDIASPMRREFNYQRKRLDPNFVPQMGGSIGIGGGQPARDTLRMGGSIGLKGGGLQKDSEDFTGEPVPCVYFANLCETLSGLEYVNLYPNPATSQITVDLMLQKAKKIRFRVFDLGGKLISEEKSPENYPDGGQVTHSVDISRLKPGFYLMVMTDEEGQRVTRRFVKN